MCMEGMFTEHSTYIKARKVFLSHVLIQHHPPTYNMLNNLIKYKQDSSQVQSLETISDKNQISIYLNLLSEHEINLRLISN